MSNLYEIVKEVINCKTIDEANNILFGVDGITINSQEYYQNIVSNFIKKKEYVIRKSGNNLVFDLKNYNDMWNIIFLGEYIKENDLLYKEYNLLLEEIDKINDELKIIKDKHKSASSKDEHLKINEEYKDKELELKDKLKLKDNYKNTIEVFYNINWVELENTNDEFKKQEAVDILKQAINIVHKLRNNIQHGSSDLDGNIKIDNEQFNVSIPISYLDGFNKGRIIANDEDKVIVEKTNTIASPLLESLGYDVKKVKSFFYNVHPEILSLLLESVNYDYNKLFILPNHLFWKDSYLLLDKLLQKYSIEQISKLPYTAFEKSSSTLDLLKTYSIEQLCELPKNSFYHLKEVKELIDNYGIDVIKKLPESAFSFYSNTVEMLKKYNIEELCKLPDQAFRSRNILKIMEKYSLEQIYKFPASAFFLPVGLQEKDNAKDFFALNWPLVKYPKLIIKLASITDVDEIYEIFKQFEIINGMETGGHRYIELLIRDFDVDKFDEYVDNKYGRDDVSLEEIKAINIEDLVLEYCNNFGPSISPSQYDTIKMWREEMLENEEILHLSPYTYYNIRNTLKIVKICGVEGINKLPINANYDYDLTAKLLSMYDIDEVAKLPYEAFYCGDFTMKLLDKYDIKIVNKLPGSAFQRSDYTQELLKKYGIEEIIKLPEQAFFKDEFTNELLEKYSIDDISKLPDNAINFNDFTRELIDKYGIELVLKLSKYLFSTEAYAVTNYKLKNVDYLINYVHGDYSMFDDFPDEFFSCSINLLDNMIKTYNTNVARSIFGINDPKLIGTLVYCDSVFKNYKKEDFDYDLIDIDPIEVIKSAVNDTYKYRNNIAGMDDNLDSYKKQFIYHDNDEIRMVNGEFDLKANILDKLRNSICHFRFKPVKDSEGNIVEDKIYLYDRDDNGVINFNMIIDIKDLVEITREVELDLIRKNVRIDYNYVEENKYRSR